jgi:hypothetical protein
MSEEQQSYTGQRLSLKQKKLFRATTEIRKLRESLRPCQQQNDWKEKWAHGHIRR